MRMIWQIGRTRACCGHNRAGELRQASGERNEADVSPTVAPRRLRLLQGPYGRPPPSPVSYEQQNKAATS
ncbi:hypothetical protein EJB05_48540, partial [Eragrostis curvula]